MTAAAMTESCVGCGKPVTREPLPGPFAALAKKLLPTCDECAAASEAETEAQERERREEERHARIGDRLKRSGLPAKYQSLEFSGLDHPELVLRAAEDWALDGGGLLLTGEVGRGKTTLAGAAAWSRLQRSPLLWTSAPLLFARLGSGFQSEQRDWALDVLASKVGLVLDDIDKARPTEYGAEQVFLAVDQRVEHESPLLVTSNLGPAQLAERWAEPYGPAIASRLVGYCTVVKIIGPDRRLTDVPAISSAGRQ